MLNTVQTNQFNIRCVHFRFKILGLEMYLTVFNKLAVQVNTFFIYIEEEIFFY